MHNIWLNQAELVFSALILLTSFIFLMQNRIVAMIHTFAWQSFFLAAATLTQAIALNHLELCISAFLTLLLKVIFMPMLMFYLVKKLDIRHKVAFIQHPFLLKMLGVAIVLFCYYLIIPLRQGSLLMTSNIIAVAMAVMLLGMLLLIVHKKAVSHILGFMSMENGIFFVALVATNGMPMTVELGIAFDVLVAAILFGVFFFHIRSSIDSLDVDQLSRLREDAE
jgi:hydrogenase-4 component E